MHILPQPSDLDIENVVEANWNKSWAVLKATTDTEVTPEMLATLAENGQGSLHFSDGSFRELSSSQTKSTVRQFCARENLDGTLKISFGNATGSSVDAWTRAFPGATVKLNYFLSTGPAKGLRPHYDDHHVFAVQLLGEKSWGLGPKIVVATPEATSFYPKQDPPVETVVQTKRGDVLYIPPGGWHGAETEVWSVHATIGIYPPTHAEYLRQLIAERASSDVVLRSELPPVILEGSTAVRFNAPSLATARQLAERTARVSASSRSQLASRLKLAYKAEMTDAVERVTESIWQEASTYNPVALYLRGSTARSNVSGIQPWDIDLVLVTRQAIPENAIRSTREGLPGVELDLKYITVRDLISAERELPVRLLLRSEGVLLLGRDIVCELPTVTPSPRMAAAIASRQVDACRVNDTILDHASGDTMMIRRCAKAALRLATPLIMRELGRLERDPVVCGWFIAARYPDIHAASEYLVACVRGENVSSTTTKEAARQLLNRLQEDLFETEVNASGQ
jgi:hypothetical protein